MKLYRCTIPFGLFFVICFAFIFDGCGMQDVECIWRNKDITIDGKDDGSEWENARHFFEDENITVGLLNDDRYLYFRLSSHDRAVHNHMVVHGLTLWLNEKGGKDKTLGIHFPIGILGASSERVPERDRSSAQDYDEKFKKRLMASVMSLEIIGPAKNSRIMVSAAEADSMGIMMGIDYTKGNLVYELRVPLMHDGSIPYGICTGVPEIIGIGVESSAPNHEAGRTQRGSRGGASGDFPGRGGIGGRGGGMGRQGGMGGMRPQMPEPIEIWLKVQLATNT